MRLTTKRNEVDRKSNYITDINNVYVDELDNGYKFATGKAIEKLGQYEDIDEKISLDSVIFFKALDQEEVYVKLPNGKIDKCSFIIEKLEENVFGFTYPIHEDDCLYYYLKDYGKTWALTRKELE